MSELQPTNPWQELPEVGPFVLPDDATAIEEFNRKAKLHTRLDLDLLPEPFIGRWDAPVVLLNLNPGWSCEDAKWHRDAGFVRRLRANLHQDKSAYPFYLLDPSQKQESEVNSPGGNWWHKRLRVLIEHVGSLETIANGLLCIEYFPYHSKSYGRRLRPVPSQEFNFRLVRSVIARDAIIVILRSRRLWQAAVPELVTYERVYTLRNPQSPYVTPNNCDGFNAIVQRLKRKC